MYTHIHMCCIIDSMFNAHCMCTVMCMLLCDYLNDGVL